MITLSIGFMLLGGGFKGVIDNRFKQPVRPIREHTPVRS